MSRSIRAEILKLRTTRMAWGLLAAAIAVTALVDVLIGARAGAGHGRLEVPPLNTLTGQSAIFTSTELALLLALVLGVTLAAGEFRHGTATPTALAVPDRSRVLAAKALVAAGVGLVFGLVASLVSAGIGLAFVAANNDTLLLSSATLLRDGAGAVLGAGLLAAMGVAVGALIRSQVAAIVLVLIWSLAGEPGLGALFPTASPYFPFSATRSLGGVTTFAGGVGAGPFYLAALLVAGIAVLLGLIASQTTVRRDIA